MREIRDSEEIITGLQMNFTSFLSVVRILRCFINLRVLCGPLRLCAEYWVLLLQYPAQSRKGPQSHAEVIKCNAESEHYRFLMRMSQNQKALSHSTAAHEAPGLARRLGPFDATMIVMGGIIGSGIFMNPHVVAGVVHTPLLILGAWAVGGL